MSIHLEKFNLLLKAINIDYAHSPSNVIGDRQIENYLNGKNIKLGRLKSLLIDQSYSFLIGYDLIEIIREVSLEIETNILILDSKEKAIDYISLLQIRYSAGLRNLNNVLNYDSIKDIGLNSPPEEKEINIAAKGVLENEGFVSYFKYVSTLMKKKNKQKEAEHIIKGYLWLCQCYYQMFERFQNTLDEIKIYIENYSNIKQISIEPAKLNLFKQVEYKATFLNLLRSVKPPIIDEQGAFILGTKSKTKYPIVAWLDALQSKGKINNQLTPSEKAAAINKEIPNLEITGRSLSNISGNYQDYFDKFKTLIDKI